MTSASGRRSDCRRDLQYLDLARAYGEAAQRLGEGNASIGTPCIPFFHLVAHATELALKAVMSFQGSDEQDLMWTGHALEGCRRDAVRGGLDAFDSHGVRSFIDSLDQPHSMQSLRYPQRLHLPLPNVGDSLRALSEILDIINSYVTTKSA
ncbi:hypothetical protein [Xanthobacter autotrophicus]|uniref:hypothetical protein n=1 Tax=Xanthobacter autotrophicus TaxID=280 RepID=UPI00372CC564